MSHVHDGVILASQSGELQFIDAAACEILELKPEQLAGQRLDAVIPDKHLATWLHRACQLQESLTQEFTTTWIEKAKQISLTVQAFSLPNGHAGCLVVLRDLTTIRRLEALQRDFITNVSHELRTPLTSIKMAAESLQLGAISDQRLKNKFLSNIQREADRLTRLVNELLVLANVQDAKTVLRLSQFDAVRLFQEVIATMEHHSEVNDLQLISDFPESLPSILADRDRLSQVLINLVDNAIKCNKPQGSVTLHVHQEGEGILIQVRDSGIGIPKMDLPRIFDRFFRVDKSRSRVTGGTGLGLSIVKDIIEAHDGTISVDSDIGQGTVFTIFLPLMPSP